MREFPCCSTGRRTACLLSAPIAGNNRASVSGGSGSSATGTGVPASSACPGPSPTDSHVSGAFSATTGPTAATTRRKRVARCGSLGNGILSGPAATSWQDRARRRRWQVYRAYTHSMHCRENGAPSTQIGRRGRWCMIFSTSKMAGLMAMLALLPGGVLSG
eukprot:COSAG02_NODE_21239_length_796_cov_213.203730_2_plen_161_part_00